MVRSLDILTKYNHMCLFHVLHGDYSNIDKIMYYSNGVVQGLIQKNKSCHFVNTIYLDVWTHTHTHTHTEDTIHAVDILVLVVIIYELMISGGNSWASGLSLSLREK